MTEKGPGSRSRGPVFHVLFGNLQRECVLPDEEELREVDDRLPEVELREVEDLLPEEERP